MSPICIEKDLDVIDVPPELRGLSDEEIIINSEKPLRDCSGKRKDGAKRPAKKVRIALKQQKELIDIQKSASELFISNYQAINCNFSSLIKEKKEMLEKAFTSRSESYSLYEEEIRETPKAQGNFENYLKKSQPKSTIPSSARVLKASFGAKTGEKAKTAIVSAADLAQQRIEERAKKIREALLNKRKKELSEV